MKINYASTMLNMIGRLRADMVGWQIRGGDGEMFAVLIVSGWRL